MKFCLERCHLELQKDIWYPSRLIPTLPQNYVKANRNNENITCRSHFEHYCLKRFSQYGQRHLVLVKKIATQRTWKIMWAQFVSKFESRNPTNFLSFFLVNVWHFTFHMYLFLNSSPSIGLNRYLFAGSECKA